MDLAPRLSYAGRRNINHLAASGTTRVAAGTAYHQGETMKRTIASLALVLSSLSCATAQTLPISPTLFGINYWYYDYAGGYDAFNVKKTQLQANGVNLVRLGGLYAVYSGTGRPAR